MAVYPYCYYFFSFPAERSIFTIDRAFRPTARDRNAPRLATGPPGSPLTRDVRISAYFWGLYLLVCFLSLAGHAPSDVLSSYRFLVDGMVMPAVLGLYAMRYFPLLEDLQKLHVVCMHSGSWALHHRAH